MKKNTKKYIKEKKKLSIKKLPGGSNIAPFNAEYILEFMSNTSQVQDLVIDPSLDFLLHSAQSKTGILQFETPIDLLLIGSWKGMGNDKNLTFLSFVVIIILLSGLFTIYKFKSLHILKFIKSKININNEEEQEDLEEQENILFKELAAQNEKQQYIDQLIEEQKETSSTSDLIYKIGISLAVIILGPAILYVSGVCNVDQKPSDKKDIPDEITVKKDITVETTDGESSSSKSFIVLFKESLSFLKDGFGYNYILKDYNMDGKLFGGKKYKSKKMITYQNNDNQIIRCKSKTNNKFNYLPNNQLTISKGGNIKHFIVKSAGVAVCSLLLVLAFISALVQKIWNSISNNSSSIFSFLSEKIIIPLIGGIGVLASNIFTGDNSKIQANLNESVNSKLLPELNNLIDYGVKEGKAMLTEDDENTEFDDLNPEQYKAKKDQIAHKTYTLQKKLEEIQKKKTKIIKKGSARFSDHDGGFIFSKLQSKLSYFVAYNGNVIPPDIIRTLYQDKDIFYLNGESYNMFSLNLFKSTKNFKLNANRNCLPFLQRISKITSLHLKDFNTRQIINNCTYNKQLKKLEDSLGNIISSCFLCINNDLEIPISINKNGIFLDGRSYCQTVAGEELQKPYSNFINEITIEYNNLTTLIPINHIPSLDYNPQQLALSNRLYKRNRSFDQMNNKANIGIDFFKKFTKS